MKHHSAWGTIEQALDDLKQGRMIILVDSSDRENEGDLVIAAEKVTAEAINFMAKYGRGLICLPLSGDYVDHLGLPLMTKRNTSKFNTAFTTSIGAAQGITTGISAADRAHTIQVAIDPNSSPEDITCPGHIFPLRAVDGGVLSRPGHTEGSVDLSRLANLKSAAVICEIMNDDGSMARRDDLEKFAQQHQLTIVSIEDLISYRIQRETIIVETAETKLPLENYGQFNAKVFENKYDQTPYLALIRPSIDPQKPPLVRIHSQCITGDIFGSCRCDCGPQLDASLEKISQEGGIFIYLLNQEGRGIGLANKLKAYALQEKGMDTVEANTHLGFAADQRDYGIAAQILHVLKIDTIRLLTNNPQKIQGIQRYGIQVSCREAIETQPTEDNLRYLRTKQQKLGHLLSLVTENN
jgi:3,4-dihydroxy 2-butanone 4-phosphate synthase/GTP cyclohydrolase II